jgi:hypothetical protein
MKRSFAMFVAALTLLGATPGGKAELEARFTTGAIVNTTRQGMQCMNSTAVLGTSNIGGSGGLQSGNATTVVNIWSIGRKSDGTNVGYVVKTFNGALWYEPPVDGLSYQPLGDTESHMLANQSITFTSCFGGDLKL